MTKREMFETVIAIVDGTVVENKAELVEGLRHEIELLDRKKASTGLTKTQKENEGLMALLVTELEAVGKAVTVTDLMKREALSQYSNQKLTSLLGKLSANGMVGHHVEHKKSYYFAKTVQEGEQD